MKAVVTVERHYRRTPEGIVCKGSEHAGFFRRYLEVFDGVLVLGRLFESGSPPTSDERSAESDNIRILPLPDFRGALEAIRMTPRLLRKMWEIAGRSDVVFILRAPGFVQLLFWLVLRIRRRPYGLEVVANPTQAYRSEAFGERGISTIIRWLVTIALREECRRANAISYVTRHELQTEFPPDTDLTFHYSSIELSETVFEHATQVFERLGNQPDILTEPRIVFVGNLDRPFKGLDILLTSIGILYQNDELNPLLEVVGDGRLRDGYETQAAESGFRERTSFHGYLPPGKAVFSVLKRADVFVLPSRREGLPRAVIEAMAVGLPCICTQVSGARELLDEKFIVPQEAPEAVADAIWELSRSKQLRLEAARRNSVRARRYANRHLQPRRNQFYRALIIESVTG